MTRCYYHRPEMELTRIQRELRLLRYSRSSLGWGETQVRDCIRELEAELSKALRRANDNAVSLAINHPSTGRSTCRLVAILPSGFVVVRLEHVSYTQFARDSAGVLRRVISDLTFGRAVLSVPDSTALPRGVQLPESPLWHPRGSRGWI